MKRDPEFERIDAELDEAGRRVVEALRALVRWEVRKSGLAKEVVQITIDYDALAQLVDFDLLAAAIERRHRSAAAEGRRAA